MYNPSLNFRCELKQIQEILKNYLKHVIEKGNTDQEADGFLQKFWGDLKIQRLKSLAEYCFSTASKPKGKFLLGTWLLQNGRKSMEVTLTNGLASTRPSHKPRQTSHPSHVHDRGKRCRRPSYTVEGTLRILSKLTEQVT